MLCVGKEKNTEKSSYGKAYTLQHYTLHCQQLLLEKTTTQKLHMKCHEMDLHVVGTYISRLHHLQYYVAAECRKYPASIHV